MVWGSLGATQIVKTEVCIWCAVYLAANSLACRYSPWKPHSIVPVAFSSVLYQQQQQSDINGSQWEMQTPGLFGFGALQ